MWPPNNYLFADFRPPLHPSKLPGWILTSDSFGNVHTVLNSASILAAPRTVVPSEMLAGAVHSPCRFLCLIHADPDPLQNVSENQYQQMRKAIIRMILATDVAYPGRDTRWGTAEDLHGTRGDRAE